MNKTKRKKFSKPTSLAMVQYGALIDLSQDECEACWDFYESKGWVVGKAPMKDWKAALRNWKRGCNKKPWLQQPRQVGQPY